MLWLASDYPLDKDPSEPGVSRGSCSVTLEHLKIWRAIIQRPLSSSPRSGLVPMEVPTLEVKLLQLLQRHQVQTQQQLLGTVIVQVVIWIPVFLFVLLNHQTFSKTVSNSA